MGAATGTDLDPFAPLLATLQPTEHPTEQSWILKWQDPPRERVRLSICAEVPPEYPDAPGMVRDGSGRCVIIDSRTVQVLPPADHKPISREQASAAVQPTLQGGPWRWIR